MADSVKPGAAGGGHRAPGRCVDGQPTPLSNKYPRSDRQPAPDSLAALAGAILRHEALPADSPRVKGSLARLRFMRDGGVP
jgi:hypothetical protein